MTTQTPEQIRKDIPLFPFQATAIKRMSQLDSVFLFDDMGLGKTRQVLESIFQDDLLPALIIPPKGLVINWYHEILKWFPEQTAVVYKGNVEKFLYQYYDALARGERRIFIIWHDVLSKSVNPYLRTGRPNRRYDEFITLLYDLPWKAIIVDEAHKFRNDGAQRTSGLLKFKHGKRFLLTGTPTVNSAEDIYPLCQFARIPGLPDLHAYLGTFTRAGRMGRPTGFINRQLFHDMIGDRWIRRTKAQVLKQLPPKITQRLYLQMEPDQKLAYDFLMRQLYLELSNGETLEIPRGNMQALALLTRLRQLALDPRIFGGSASSIKSKAILDLLAEHQSVTEDGEKRKAIIYSNFVGYLNILEWDLRGAGYGVTRITGKEDTSERKYNESRFQNDPNTTVLLVSMAAGGEGLNLTAATLAIVADEWWNSVRMNQAVDRSHRIGQNRQLLAITLHVVDSVDDYVHEIVEGKEATSQMVLQALVEGTSRTEEGKKLLEELSLAVAP